MNLLIGAPLWLVIVLGVLLAAAAVEDALRFRISNLTCAGVLAAAVCAAVLEGVSVELWQNLAVFAILLVLGTAAFAAKLLGGGDVKLFAALGLWFDLSSAVWLVALVFLAGGAVAIAYLLARPWRRAPAKDRRVPYGIAIAIGGLAVIATSRGTFEHHNRPLPAIKINRPHA